MSRADTMPWTRVFFIESGYSRKAMFKIEKAFGVMNTYVFVTPSALAMYQSMTGAIGFRWVLHRYMKIMCD